MALRPLVLLAAGCAVVDRGSSASDSTSADKDHGRDLASEREWSTTTAEPGHACHRGGFCTDFGERYRVLDCDNDGIADPYCEDGSGRSGYLGSTRRCANTWPSGGCQGHHRPDVPDQRSSTSSEPEEPEDPNTLETTSSSPLGPTLETTSLSPLGPAAAWKKQLVWGGLIAAGGSAVVGGAAGAIAGALAGKHSAAQAPSTTMSLKAAEQKLGIAAKSLGPPESLRERSGAPAQRSTTPAQQRSWMAAPALKEEGSVAAAAPPAKTAAAPAFSWPWQKAAAREASPTPAPLPRSTAAVGAASVQDATPSPAATPAPDVGGSSGSTNSVLPLGWAIAAFAVLVLLGVACCLAFVPWRKVCSRKKRGASPRTVSNERLSRLPQEDLQSEPEELEAQSEPEFLQTVGYRAQDQVPSPRLPEDVERSLTFSLHGPVSAVPQQGFVGYGS